MSGNRIERDHERTSGFRLSISGLRLPAPAAGLPGILIALVFLCSGSVVLSQTSPVEIITDAGEQVEGKDALGFHFLLELEPNQREREHFDNRLVSILEAYRERSFIEMQEMLNSLFMRDPDARRYELPRLLEAEVYYFNGGDNSELRILFAKPIYSELISLFPRSRRNAQKLFRLGSILFQQEYFPEAEGRFSFLLESYPESGLVRKAHLFLGETGLAIDDPELASEEFTIVYEDAMASPSERFAATAGLAICRIELGLWEEAAAFFSTIVGSAEDRAKLDEKTLYAYGELQRALGRGKVAQEAFEELLATYPDTKRKAVIWFRMSDQWAVEGQRERAMAGYRRIVEKFPKSEWGYYAALRIGEMLTAASPGEWSEEAGSNFRHVIDNLFYPKLGHNAQLALARMMLSVERYEDALEVLDDLLSGSINNDHKRRGLDMSGRAFEGLVSKKFEEEDYPSICRIFVRFPRSIININERMKPETFDRLTEAFYQTLLFDSLYAIGVSREALRLFPNRAELARARAEAARGNTREAGVIFRVLAQRDRGFVGRKAALLNVRMESREGNHEAVIALAEAALAMRHDPVDMGELLVLRSRSRLALGDTVSSIEGFRQAVNRVLPADRSRKRWVLADALFGLGEALYQSGKRSQAAPVLEAALGAFPKDARSGLARLYLERIGNEELSEQEDSLWIEISELLRNSDEWMREKLPRINAEQ